MTIRSFSIAFLLLFVHLNSTHSQVTIGSQELPVKGALLDLKQNGNNGANSNKGFLLPRVALEEKKALKPCVSETTEGDNSKELAHVGLMVYNTATVFREDLCPGIYVWTSESWSRLYGECSSFKILGLEDLYVMDGQEYSVTVDSPVKWDGKIRHDDNVLQFMSDLKGNEGATEVKFRMAVSPESMFQADGKIEVELSKQGETETAAIVAIKGVKTTLVVPSNVEAYIKVTTVEIPFAFSSNSSLPIAVTELPEWVSYDAERKMLVIQSGSSIIAGVYPFLVSNGVASRTVNLTMKVGSGGGEPVDPENPGTEISPND